MKFIIYHENGKTKTINAKDLDDAEKKANEIWKGWSDIKFLRFAKPRKSATLNKRSYIKKSDKIYNRDKSKRDLKKEIKKEVD